MTVKPPSTSQDRKKKSQLWIVLLAFILFGALALHKIAGAISFDFFVWGDHVLHTNESNDPVLSWVFAGFLPGAAAGGIIAQKKYRLRGFSAIPFLLVTILVICLLQISSSPLQAIAPSHQAYQPNQKATPSLARWPRKSKLSNRSYDHVKRHKNFIQLPQYPVPGVVKTSTSNTPVADAADSCETSQLPVFIDNDNEGIVTLHFMTKAYKGGPWTGLKTESLLRGQYTLTYENNKVVAYSIQYTYEANGMEVGPIIADACSPPMLIKIYRLN